MDILLKLKTFAMEILYKNWAMESKLISAAMLNRDTFLPYKNLCRGEQEVVVCGAGPSLKKYKPLEGAVHIAVNRAFLYDKVKFDFIFSQDYDGIKMVKEELIQYAGHNCIKLLGTSDDSTKEIPEAFAIKCGAKRFATDAFIFHNGFRSEFVADIASRPIGGMPNVGMSVVQFALYLNPSKLYIVGCDMTGTHFSKGHQTVEELKKEKAQYDKYWTEENKRLLNKWKEIKAAAKRYYPYTEMICVNPVGLKGIFRDLYQESFEDKRKVFENGK